MILHSIHVYSTAELLVYNKGDMIYATGFALLLHRLHMHEMFRRFFKTFILLYTQKMSLCKLIACPEAY